MSTTSANQQEPRAQFWAHGTPNSDDFTGDFPTPEDAAAALLEDNPEFNSAEVGRAVQHEASRYLVIDGILEDIACRASDLGGEAADDWVESIEGVNADAKAQLCNMISQWLTTHAGPPDFAEITDVRTITREELVNIGVLEGKE